MYDIIGDIHGHATALKALLEQLGFARIGDTWRHPSRQALFVGDFLDRGPEIAETVAIVRGMVDAGAARAVLGNHEMNAIAYATARADAPGKFCREHSDRNRRQHEATLSQLSASERAAALAWFRTLPLALDLGGVRVVHACWDDASLRVLEELLRREGGLTDTAIRVMHDESTPAFTAMEMVLKGPEIPLPVGVVMHDAEGHPRRMIRARWFERPRAWTYDEVIFPPSSSAPTNEVPQLVRRALPYYPREAPPLFFGHYWMPANAAPTLLAPNLACLDWSVARGGRLVAYRWDGERTLDPAKMLWAPAGAGREGSDSARTMAT